MLTDFYSIAIDVSKEIKGGDPNSVQIQISLLEFLLELKKDLPHIVNFLDLPNETGDQWVPKHLCSDMAAWNRLVHPNCRDLPDVPRYPTKENRWHLCASCGAFTLGHFDMEGYATWCTCRHGKKFWIVFVPKKTGDWGQFADLETFGDIWARFAGFDPVSSNESVDQLFEEIDKHFRMVGFILEAGDTM